VPPRRTTAALTRTSRLEGLSDGTFAIVITLLVLEIHRPSAPPGHLAQGLAREWPSYVAYVVAFINIGVIWLNHHYVFSQIERTDLTLNWINLGILATATLIPFPTGVLAGAFDGTSLADQKAAVVLYAVIALLMSAAWIPLFAHLRRHPDMLKEAIPPDRFADEVIRPVTGIAGYIVAVACGWLIHPLTGMAIFILIVAYYAATSTGIRTRLLQAEYTPADGNAKEPAVGDGDSTTT
jgi:uncharacterized membrane protein